MEQKPTITINKQPRPNLEVVLGSPDEKKIRVKGFIMKDLPLGFSGRLNEKTAVEFRTGADNAEPIKQENEG